MQKEDEKMGICMLGHKRISSREGGIEIVVEELATRVVKSGHSVLCYNHRGHHVSDRTLDYNFYYNNGDWWLLPIRTISTLFSLYSSRICNGSV